MTEMAPSAAHKIVAFIFADSQRAPAVDAELKAAGKYESYKVIANAVVEVDDKGKPHVHEAGHAARGAGIGLVAGGLLGLLGGPAALLLLAISGAVIGGIAGKVGGRAIPGEDVDRLAAQMRPDSSAILALVEETDVDALIAGMAGYAAQVITLAISDEVSAEIHQATAMPGTSAASGQGAGAHQAAALPGQAPPTSARSTEEPPKPG